MLAPPVALFICAGAAWYGVVLLFDLPPVLLPSPPRVLEAMWQNRAGLALATLFTAGAALAGLLLSSLGGVLVAMLFSQSVVIRRSCYPYAIFLQTVPIVAVAPLIVIWIGEGFAAIVVVAFIISLFPIITNATDGLLSVPTELRELFRLNRASRWQILWHLQLPHALPRILTGVKIASATAVLGAIVGEFFTGASARVRGLGNLIFAANGQFRLDILFAAIFLCTFLGVTIFYSVSFLGQRYLLYWCDPKELE
jgi:NitT/TauT family transport system permease protein